jgi:hypothetical protein
VFVSQFFNNGIAYVQSDVIMNCELGKKWNEVAVEGSKVLPQQLLVGTV